MSLSLFDAATISISLFLSVFLYYHTTVRVPKGLRLPPGPPGHFIWGNFLDFLSGALEYKVYEKWAKKYGDLVYLNNLGQSILLINSVDMERELFSKRGAIYSDRVKTMMIHELSIVGKTTTITMEYGERWTRHRAIFHDILSKKNLVSYNAIVEEHARSLAKRLIAEPVNDLRLVRVIIGEFIMGFTYGIDVLPEDDPYMNLAERFTHQFTHILFPGTFKVDLIPILKYLPSWFPGLEFPKVTREFNESFQDMLNIPYEYSKKAYKQGHNQPSFVSDCLEDLASNPNLSDEARADSEDIIREVAVTIYLAGIDTANTQIRLFFLAMALYPDVQKKAQEELDKVIGRDNLPSFSDLPNLPYFNALCDETLRWHTMVPLGVPRQLKQDDVVNGYFIPKGTICFGNAWFLLLSEKEYGPDTHKFRPERYLDGSAKSKPDVAFGSARRKCAGKELAKHLVNITLATVLHVADISELKDEPLCNIIDNDEFTPGIIARPRDFSCRVDGRPDAQKLLK